MIHELNTFLALPKKGVAKRLEENGLLDKLTIKLEPRQLTDADRQKASKMIARARDDR
jgi:hypothetical protein